MSALPNPLQSRQLPKKPVGRAKQNRLWERQRKSSDYEKGTGYAPLFHGMLADWGRISSGHICDMMRDVCLCKSLGRTVSKGKAREEWTEDITYSEVAQLCAASDEWPKMLRSVEREFTRWNSEGIAEVVKTAPGTVKVRLKYREWSKVKDYRSNVVEITPAPEEPESEDEAEETREGFQKFKAITVAPGKASKPLPINCGVKTVQFQTGGQIDIHFSAVIKAGCQVVTASVPDEWIAKLGKTHVGSAETKGLQDKFGRGCRTAEENHSDVVKDPKAAKLCDIFNPLLAKSRQPSLESNLSALQSACDALGDFPVNDLVEFLEKGRVHRPVSSPRVVALIIGDAKRDAAAMAKLPVEERPVTPEEIERLIQAERAELQRKRAAMKGRKS